MVAVLAASEHMFTRGLVLSGGRISVLILVALAAGCAGTSDSKSGAGAAGATGATGAAGATSSAGGDAGGAGHTAAGGGSAGSDAGLPAQGAFSVRVAAPSPAVNGMACPVSGTTYAVGSPSPTVTDPGNSVVSEQNGAVISCSVRGQPLSFTASIHATASSGDPVTFALMNGVLTAAGKGTATLAFFSPQLAGQFTSPTPCQVSVVGGQAKPGSMWASFSCDALSSPPSGLCSASGVFVLENCDGS